MQRDLAPRSEILQRRTAHSPRASVHQNGQEEANTIHITRRGATSAVHWRSQNLVELTLLQVDELLAAGGGNGRCITTSTEAKRQGATCACVTAIRAGA